MSKKNKAEATETQNNQVTETETSAEIDVTVPETDNELVMEASVKEYIPSTYVILTNTSQNRISLVADDIRIDLEPREIKRDVRRSDLQELLKNKVVKKWFDKGILTSNIDADDTSAHEAVAPSNLTSAVERHDNGMNIEASVKKFVADGTVDINLL